MANDDKHTGNSEVWIHTTNARADAPVIEISRGKLKSLMEVEIKSADETARLEKMKSMSRNLKKTTHCDIFTTE